tara:strand:+ start:513 stop:1007 length:495 start_codon:yes stop_codon:yes gene_type:complete
MTTNNTFVAFARDGNLEGIKHLVSEGVDPDTTNVAGASAIELASQNGHGEIVSFLLSQGASPDPTTTTKPHSSALIYASTNGDLEIVQQLILHGANVNLIDDAYEQTALIWACAYGKSVEVVKTLLDAGADASIKDVNGNTALVLSEYFGFDEITSILLQNSSQ